MKSRSALWLGVVSFSLVSVSAQASIEVKAKRMLTESAMTENVAKVKTACGNEVLETNFDWSAWDNYDFGDARLDKVKTTGWIGGLINYIYDDMVKLCTTTEHAALYKGEFQKVQQIQFVGQDSVNARKAGFSLDDGGSTLKVALNPNAAYDSSTLKYLKQAWN